MIGRGRPERVFSMGHTGGDLSLPDEVRRRVMPSPFPIVDAAGGADSRVRAPDQEMEGRT